MKISVIGAGNVGATCAQRIAEKGFADVVLLDVIEGVPQGKALDILQSAAVLKFGGSITGTNSYEDTAGSDVVVITAGAARQPGMSRDDLLNTNMKIVTQVVEGVARTSPKAIIVMVTNPVDAMTTLALKVSGFPRKRVVGLSGVLDGARLATFIAAELSVPVADVSAMVLGEHGSNMVVIPRLSTVGGRPLTDFASPETAAELANRTVNGGLEIVKLLKAGSAYYAPSASAAAMAEAIALDKKEIMPCATLLEGEYGINNTVIGVPVKLGKEGIESIIELDLTAEEKEKLAASAEAVSQTVARLKL